MARLATAPRRSLLAGLALGVGTALATGRPLAGVAQTTDKKPFAAGQGLKATAECPRLIVPAYFSPGPDWERIIAAAPAVEIVILNVNSGPGEAPDPAFQDVVWRAQAAGIKVLGYVFTDLGNEDPDNVKAQIRAYQEWYGVDGIHLDGAEDDPEAIPYYRDIAETIWAGGRPGVVGGEDLPGIVMLNPGYVPDEGFMEFADIVEVYEWYFDRYPGQEFPDWLYDYPADRFAHVIRDVPNSEPALMLSLELARERGAGYVYATDLTDFQDADQGEESHEYDRLPSFWDSKVRALCR